jgi:hypothetical protein
MRNRHTYAKSYRSGLHKIGLVSVFLIVVFSVGGCVLYLFHSQLTAGAEFLVDPLKRGGEFLTPYLVAAIRFLMMSRKHDTTPATLRPDQSGSGSITGGISENGTGALQQFLLYGLVALFLLVLLLVAGFLIKKLLAYLFHRETKAEKDEQATISLKGLLLWIQRYCQAIAQKAGRWIRGFQDATQLYAGLLSWGRRGGVKRRITETPLEYAARLASIFPSFEREIETIVGLFNREVFGETALTRKEMIKGSRAWKALRNPKHWPMRLRTWLLSAG